MFKKLDILDEKEEICARSYGDRFVLLLAWEDQELFLQRLKEMQRLVEVGIYEATESHMSLHMGVYCLAEDEESLKLSVGYANQALEATGNSNTSEMKVYDAPFEEMIRERHQLLSLWLTKLGVPEDIASEDACKLEHVLSVESFEAIKRHVNAI